MRTALITNKWTLSDSLDYFKLLRGPSWLSSLFND